MRKPFATAIAAALTLLLGAAAADAGPRRDRDFRDNGREAQRGHSQRSVNDVINEVERRYGGKVVGVQRADQNTYRVRVLQRDGRVKTLHVPADGGR